MYKNLEPVLARSQRDIGWGTSDAEIELLFSEKEV